MIVPFHFTAGGQFFADHDIIGRIENLAFAGSDFGGGCRCRSGGKQHRAVRYLGVFIVFAFTMDDGFKILTYLIFVLKILFGAVVKAV